MSDVYGMLPINKTAAIVTGQKGCSDNLTPEQERESILDRVNQVESVLLSLPKGSKERKELGMLKLELCSEISKINIKIKKRKVTDSTRKDYVDCVFSIMKLQLSTFQYKNIIRLADDLYKQQLEQEASK